MNRPSVFVATCCLTFGLFAADSGAQTEGQPDRRESGNLDQGTDNCPGLAILSIPYSDTGTTQARLNNFTGNCTGADARDVIYRFTPAVTQLYRISLCGSGFDTGLYVRTGGACPGTTELACNDNFCGAQSELNASLAAGTEYFIIVDGAGTSSGAYVLNVTAAPPGDNCENPIVINELPFCACQSSAGFTNDYAPAGCPGVEDSFAPDVVYSFTPADSITTSVSLCGSSYNTILTVWQGCPGGPESVLLACNDDGPGCGPSSLIRDITFMAGVTYTIVVDGRGTEAGEFALNIEGRGGGIGDVDPVACVVTCPPGATPEGENWVAGVPDHFNSGFFGYGSFLPIACGQTICGTSSNTANDRDLDAYRLTLPSFQKMVVCFTAEFEADIFVSDSVNCA